MRTLFCGQPSRRAISARTNDGPWQLVCTVTWSGARIGDRGERLEGEMQALLGVEGVLEHMRRRGKAASTSPRRGARVDRHVGRVDIFQMLEVGEASGRAQLVVHIDLRGHGFDLVVDRRHLLVFGDDLRDRGLGDMGIARNHRGDRLADEAHLVEREDRLIVEGGP